MELKNIHNTYSEILVFVSKILSLKDILCIASIGKDISFYPSSYCLPSNIQIDYISEVIEYLVKKQYDILKIVFEKENRVLIAFKYKDRVFIIFTKKDSNEIYILGYIKSLFYTENFLKEN